MVIEYDSGETVHSVAGGTGSEVDIRFEKNIVKFPPAYITLSARKTFRIFNKSDIKVSINSYWSILIANSHFKGTL